MGGCVSSETSHDVRATQANGQHAAHFQVIRDRFESIEEVQSGLRQAGLEASELILAIDLTKSNEWSGKRSFGGRCLHATDLGNNPYKSVISIIAKTLAAFDDDHLIPTFGFGDSTSKGHSLISFEPDGKPIHELENVLTAYDRLAPTLTLSGPTSFAPAIYKAIELVEASGGAFHVLLIIADGQVSGGSCYRETVDAIVEAANYPLSIVMVGVGDGPWETMRNFDDGLPSRKFDNFQFVNFTEIGERAALRNYTTEKWEADFALSALMEIPDQYALINRLGMLLTRQKRPIKPISVLKAANLHAAGSASFAAASQSLYSSQGQVAPGVPVASSYTV